MSISYQQLLRDVGIRVNALVGAQVAAINTTYDTVTLNQSHFKSADWPFNSFRDAIIMAEGDFARAIAENPQHPERATLITVTNPLIHRTFLPDFGIGGSKHIIGVYGPVTDAADGTVLTEKPLTVIERRVRNTNSRYLVPVYWFKIHGERIFHTRESVIIEVCVYDRNDRLAAFMVSANMLLGDSFQAPIVARAITLMTKGKVSEERTAIYNQFAEEALAAVRALKPMPQL